MESIRMKLCRVRQAANSIDKMDPVLARSIIESAYLAIEQNMLNAIPWPEVAPREVKAPCHWQECIRSLQGIRRRIIRHQNSPSLPKDIIVLNKVWRKAVFRTMSLSACRSTRKYIRPESTSLPHQLYSAPSIWAANLGFNLTAVNEWLSTSHDPKDVTCSKDSDPLLGYPLVAIPSNNWADADQQGRLSMIPPLRFMVKKAASFNLRTVNSEYLKNRKQTLRKLNISKWARTIKPASKVSQGFAASWFTPPDGPPRRPVTSEEARKGAVQEWSKLMIEPAHKWSSPLISQYKDEYGRPRGTMNLEVACNAPPNSNLRVIAQAYMGSAESGYSIAYWSLG